MGAGLTLKSAGGSGTSGVPALATPRFISVDNSINLADPSKHGSCCLEFAAVILLQMASKYRRKDGGICVC